LNKFTVVQASSKNCSSKVTARQKNIYVTVAKNNTLSVNFSTLFPQKNPCQKSQSQKAQLNYFVMMHVISANSSLNDATWRVEHDHVGLPGPMAVLYRMYS
jgi:hypothetical protein